MPRQPYSVAFSLLFISSLSMDSQYCIEKKKDIDENVIANKLEETPLYPR
jgi:hypothetical protein